MSCLWEKNYGLFCILGPEEHLLLGISHVKNSKKWKWDSGRPTPVFQNFHIFLFKPACSNLLTAAKYRLHLRVIYAALVWAVTTIKVQRKPDHAGNGFGLRLLLQDSSNWLVRYWKFKTDVSFIPDIHANAKQTEIFLEPKSSLFSHYPLSKRC